MIFLRNITQKIFEFLNKLCCALPILILEPKDKTVCPALARATALVIMFGIPVLLFVASIMSISLDTHIRADFNVDRLVFSVDEISSPVVLPSINYQTVDIYRFKKIQFLAKNLMDKKIQYIANNLLEIKPTIDNVFTKVSFSNLDENSTGKLENPLLLPKTQVALKIERKSEEQSKLIIKLQNYQNKLSIIPPPSFKMILEYATFSTTQKHWEYDNTSKEFSAEIDLLQNTISVVPNNSIEIILDVPNDKTYSLVNSDFLPVTNIELFSESKERKVISSLVNDGEITYVGYPNKPKITFKNTDILSFNKQDKFFIEKIFLNLSENIITVSLNGTVSKFSISYPFASDKNRLLTVYDWLQESRFFGTITNSAIWAIPIILALSGLFIIGRVYIERDESPK